jgi:hypothetical protein
MSDFANRTEAGKLSVPDYRRKPVTPPTAEERAALHRIADALIPPHGDFPSPSAVDGYDKWLDRALAARNDATGQIYADARRFDGVEDGELFAALRTFSEEEPERFHLLSTIVADGYLMIPAVRRAIGYPGQPAHPPRFDEAAGQIMDGILDPVLARGQVYTSAPRESKFA